MRPPANDHHPSPDITKTHDTPRQSGRAPAPARANHNASGTAYSKRSANRRELATYSSTISNATCATDREPVHRPHHLINRTRPAPHPKAITAAIRQPRPPPSGPTPKREQPPPPPTPSSPLPRCARPQTTITPPRTLPIRTTPRASPAGPRPCPRQPRRQRDRLFQKVCQQARGVYVFFHHLERHLRNRPRPLHRPHHLLTAPGPRRDPCVPRPSAAAVREPRPSPRPGGRHRNENDRFRRLRRRRHHPHPPGAPARRRLSPLPGVAKDARRLAPGRPGPLPSRANRDAGGSAYSKRAAKRRELATYSSTILNTTCAADCGSFIDPTTCPT